MSRADVHFSAAYSAVYDLLHRDKPYREEAAFVLDRYREATGATPKHAIDLACGTGWHVAEFCDRGIFTQGNDLSEGMIARARTRLSARGVVNHALTVGPMERVESRCPEPTGFALATAFYTALGYLVEPASWDAFLKNLGRLLQPGGLLFADLWSGHKMSRDFSPQRTRLFEDEEFSVRRISDVTHLPGKNALNVRFNFEIARKQSGEIDRFSEEHLIRYYTEAELRTIFNAYGFRLVGAGPFFDQATRVEDSWNFWILAQRLAQSE